MKIILADANVIGQVEYLVRRMQAQPWGEFWSGLDLVLQRFEDVGLDASSTDLEIWQTCQDEQLILVTDNRNRNSDDSLEAAIRNHNGPNSLPIFTISKMSRFATSSSYVDKVVKKFYEYLIDFDSVLGAGRIYLP